MENDHREQASLLSKQVKKKHTILRTWAQANAVQAFRLYDRDIPDIPLHIDLYGKYLHLAAILKSGSEEQDRWIHEMAGAAARTLGIPSDHVFVKNKKKHGGQARHDPKQGGGIFTIEEGGLRFEINLSDYLDTGLFLDHRRTRSFIREIAGGSRVLNLFSYTGSFSVYAAHGGAMTTTSVDMSNTYSNWAGRNMEQNGFFIGKLHSIVTANVLDWMNIAVKKQNSFDIIICDPPTFSNSNKMSRPFSVQKDHPWLLQQCLKLLSREGLIVFSSNYRQFKFSERELAGLMHIEEITAETIPRDFAKRKPHHCWLLRPR